MGSFAGSGTAPAVYLGPARRQSVACVPTSTGDLMKMRGIPAARHPVSSICLGCPRGGPFFWVSGKFSAAPDSAGVFLLKRKAERMSVTVTARNTVSPSVS